MKCPEADPGFWADPRHGWDAQKELVLRVAHLCRRGYPVAVDAGAHIGVWSARLVELGFQVHAFEPIPENFECLRENTKDLDVRCYPYGLADSPGKTALRKESVANSGMWHVATGPHSDPVIKLADVVTLDSQNLTDVGLIKLDVEGYEGRVLLGAEQTVLRDKPVIVFEDNGVGQKYFGMSWIDPKKVLRDLGYIKQARVRKDEIWLPA
jgi:FkbM family methyltransferase